MMAAAAANQRQMQNVQPAAHAYPLKVLEAPLRFCSASRVRDTGASVIRRAVEGVLCSLAPSTLCPGLLLTGVQGHAPCQVGCKEV